MVDDEARRGAKASRPEPLDVAIARKNEDVHALAGRDDLVLDAPTARLARGRPTQARLGFGEQGDGQTGTAIATVDGLTLNTGDNIMVAEAVFEYQPLIYPDAVFDTIFGGRRIVYSSSYMAREIALPTITNTTGIPAGSWQTMANDCPASS